MGLEFLKIKNKNFHPFKKIYQYHFWVYVKKTKANVNHLKNKFYSYVSCCIVYKEWKWALFHKYYIHTHVHIHNYRVFIYIMIKPILIGSVPIHEIQNKNYVIKELVKINLTNIILILIIPYEISYRVSTEIFD